MVFTTQWRDSNLESGPESKAYFHEDFEFHVSTVAKEDVRLTPGTRTLHVEACWY